MIEFRTLGTLDLRRANGPALDSLLAQPKRIALLAYLCLARPYGFHRRDTIIGLFWPESDQTRARASLRRALHVLRLTLGEDAFHARGDEEIAPNSVVIWCDGVAFEERVAANEPIDALDLYKGDLLPGFFLDEAPEFNRWLDDERSRLRSSAARAAKLAAESHESDRNLDEAVRSARRAVELTGNDEREVRQLMGLLARVGDRAGALQVYDDFAGRVAAELEIEPSAETRAFADYLRSVRLGSTPSLGSDVPTPLKVTAGNGAYAPADLGPRRRWTWIGSAIGLFALATGAASLVRTVGSSFTLPVTERRKLTFNGMATQAALSPDGQFLAYLVQERDSNRLIVQDQTGGPADTIFAFAPAAVDHLIEWSPNNARLLVRLPGRVLMIHRRGGQQEIVRAFKPGDEAHWLPDGSRVSLSNLHAGRFLLVNPENGDSLSLHIAASHAASWDGSWSRDGQVFAVVTDSPDSARWVIRGVSLDGRVEPLVSDSMQLNSPRWSGDGTELYYLRGTDAIWRVPVSTRTGKTTGPPAEVETGIDALPGIVGVIHFSLSRNGHNLVYAKGERYSNIYRVTPVDSATPPRMERLTSGTALRWSPVVSPDGKWIAFAAETKDGSELFRMPIAGGRALQITEGARVWPRSEIAWSPDGQYVAFQTVRASSCQIAIANVSSGQVRRFEHTNASIRTSHLTWAPGSRIAYQIPRTYIHLLDPATGHDTLLVRDTADAWFHYPRYSPNGEEIAMVRYHEPERSLTSILRVADGSEKRLSTGLVHPRAWAADGRFIYAQAPLQPRLLRIDSRGKKAAEPIFTAPVREMECTPDPSRHEHSFICAMFDFFSDIWTIENFDRRSH
jgi:serine/threonine-protein kinase